MLSKKENYEIPHNWSEEKFSDLLEKDHYPIEMLDNEYYRLLSIRRRNGGFFEREWKNGKEILTKNLHAAKVNNFVISKMQAYHGAFAVTSEEYSDGVLSGSYISYKVNEKINPLYLSYLSNLPDFYKKIRLSCHGVHIEKMTFDTKDWAENKIIYPPMKEQTKIIRILTSVDEAIKKTTEIIEQTEKVKTGIMHQLLTKGIGHTEFKETDIGEIPINWQVKSLEEIGTWFGGGTPSKQEEQYWEKEPGVIWISPKDMYETIITYSQDYISQKGLNAKGLKLLPVGSILFVTRSGILRSRVPISIAGHELTINQDLKALCVNPEYNNEYVFYSLLAYNERIRKSCVKVGTTVESIDVPSLKNFLIPVPPKDEQEKIKSFIKSYYLKIQHEKEYLSKLNIIKKGLMQELLTGKVRVPVGDLEVISF